MRNCLFVLRSLPDKDTPPGIESALAAAAMERQPTILLAADSSVRTLQRIGKGEAHSLSLLGAADLFGIEQVVCLQTADDETPLPDGLPVPLRVIEPGRLAEFVAGFDQVFSYP